MTPDPYQRSLEIEAAEALAALQRARKRAEGIARATGTKLILAVDGKPVRVDPPPADGEL